MTLIQVANGAAVLVWLASCLSLVWVDMRSKLLPNRLIARGSLATFAILALSASLSGDGWALISGSGLALLSGLFFLVLALLARGSFGMGDVKFAPLCFSLVSLKGFEALLIAISASFISAAAVGLIMMIASRRGLKWKFPFGPFMFLGSILALLT
jgi:leader peptidase (prepilin peptidase)/N-methyltransferase